MSPDANFLFTVYLRYRIKNKSQTCQRPNEETARKIQQANDNVNIWDQEGQNQ